MVTDTRDAHLLQEWEEEETPEEQQARLDTEVVLTEEGQARTDALVDMLMRVCDDISGHPLRPYQKPFARRVFESMLISDGEKLTALFSRQSGKTEAVADVVVTCMIMLPILARVYPDDMALEKYSEGVWVGAFAPVEDQARNLYSRITERLRSERCAKILRDPEINDKVIGKGNETWLKNSRSMVRKKTCHAQAIIEGWTYHLILVDEAQGGNDKAIKKHVLPMGASTEATVVYTGTCDYTKNFFYDQIQLNKRIVLERGRRRQNHFEVDWREVGRHVPRYLRQVKRDMLAMGPESDEFRLSYKLEWLIEKGMFTTAERIKELGDVSMQYTVPAYTGSPVVVGIDLARIVDRTVVTVIFVDWNHPDADGYYHHQILNWLDLEGVDWQKQYPEIADFLAQYNIWKVGVDTGGLGDVVISDLRQLMPHIDFVAMGDSPADQSQRWKYLKQLMERNKISWPYGSRVKNLSKWKRFVQEMQDLKVEYKPGGIMKCEAPDETGAHDDYPCSLNMGVWLSRMDSEESVEQVQVYENMLVGRRAQRYQ